MNNNSENQLIPSDTQKEVSPESTCQNAVDGVVGTYKAIENGVVGTYKAIEDSVVGAYKAIEDGVVGAYKSVEDTMVDKLFRKEGETVEEAKARLSGK